METKVIGIAGGSGSGKSTLAYNLERIFSESVSVLHMDDYYVDASEIPTFRGFKNFDSPKAIDSEKIISDVRTLLSGRSVSVMTRHERYNPEYKTTREKIPFEVVPQQLLLVEGFLALHSQELRDLMSYSIFLELSEENMLIRRKNNIRGTDESIQHYNNQVLLPMHRLHVIPTAENAHLKINALQFSEQEVLEKTLGALEFHQLF